MAQITSRLLRALFFSGLVVACGGDKRTSSRDAGGGGNGGNDAGGNDAGGNDAGGNDAGGNDAGGNDAGGNGGTAGDSGSAPVCDTPPPSRGLQFIIDPPAPVDAGSQSPPSEDLSGTITAVTAAQEPCSAFPAYAPPECKTNAMRVAIAGGDASVRTLVIASASVDEWMPTMAASIGKRVSLAVRHARGFQWNISSGFVLSDADGPLMAAEAGPWVPTLRPGDLPDVQVTLGTPLCRYRSSCSTFLVTAMNFRGDTSVSVDRVTDGEFLLHSRRYGARNIDGGVEVLATCTDLEHVSTWAIWRKAP